METKKWLSGPACKLGLHPMTFFHRGEGVWHCFCGERKMEPIPPATKRVPIPEGFYDEFGE